MDLRYKRDVPKKYSPKKFSPKTYKEALVSLVPKNQPSQSPKPTSRPPNPLSSPQPVTPIPPKSSYGSLEGNLHSVLMDPWAWTKDPSFGPVPKGIESVKWITTLTIETKERYAWDQASWNSLGCFACPTKRCTDRFPMGETTFSMVGYSLCQKCWEFIGGHWGTGKSAGYVGVGIKAARWIAVDVEVLIDRNHPNHKMHDDYLPTLDSDSSYEDSEEVDDHDVVLSPF